MHIPDGYLGPITCGASYAVMVPLWAIAAKKVKKSLQAKQAPLLAIGAAYCFVIMMFNIPIPCGTTGHAVGGVLAAIVLGPWAACIAVSVALALQALLFGDGGITALGANCFNMAFVMPFAGYAVYRAISGNSALTALRRVAGAGIGGYVGLVAASAFAGLEFGLQPLLHHTAAGQSLYCPYGLRVTVPAMVGAHALVFGWAELIATALVVKFLQKQEPGLLQPRRAEGKSAMKTTTKLWIGLGVLAVVSPLGLFLPDKFNAGPAWGEWKADELKGVIGYIPSGLQKLSSLWNAVMPDYAFKGWKSRGLGHLGIAYMISAATGIALCFCVAFIIGKLLARRGAASPRPPRRAGNALVERSLLRVAGFVKEAVASDEVAARRGFLQSCDPRAKCLSIALLLIVAVATRSIVVLGGLYVLALLLAVCSSIGLFYFLKRTVPFIPLFSFCIALPALFSAISPGETVAAMTVFSHSVVITRQGIGAASIFCARVLVSVSLAVLLVLTTRQHALLKALRMFRLPQVFVMAMGMASRYIFLLLDIMQNTFIAVKSRVGFVTSPKTGRKITGVNMANLWLRSYRLHEEVYSAMISRGYGGEPRVFNDFRLRRIDAVLPSVALFFLIGALWLNRFLR